MAKDADRTGMVRLPLTPEDLGIRADKMAALWKEIGQLEAEKARESKRLGTRITELTAEMNKTTEEFETGESWVPAQTQNPILMGSSPPSMNPAEDDDDTDDADESDAEERDIVTGAPSDYDQSNGNGADHHDDPDPDVDVEVAATAKRAKKKRTSRARPSA